MLKAKKRYKTLLNQVKKNYPQGNSNPRFLREREVS